MEAIVRDKLTHFITTFNVISPKQHGFMARRSTVTQLLSCLREWTSAMENSQCVDIAYLDFKSAFTSVSHSKLISILRHIGIRGQLLQWLKCFLSNRTEIVKIGNSMSEAKEVISGVPQGTILGPLCFILYINSIENTVKEGSLSIYADDCKVFASFPITQVEPVLNNDLQRILDWAQKSQLSLSIQKCSILHLGYNNPTREYILNGLPLKSSRECLDLGVSISSDLKFSTHCQTIASKASQRAGSILRFFETKDPHFLFSLFRTFCRPILEYASEVWSPHFKKDIDIIENVQRSFTKRLFVDRTISYEARLTILRDVTLQTRRNIADLCMVYKIVHGLTDLNFETFFAFAPNRNTRGNSLKLFKPSQIRFVRSVDSFFSNRVINPWNRLPDEIVTAPSLQSFKTRVRKYLSSNQA